MAACRGCHGGPLRLSLVVLVFIASGAVALVTKNVKRKGHTLDDALISNITSADVEHNDVLQFVTEGIAYMERLGIKLSDECERRYGYTFITDQKAHHFRLCKSTAQLTPDGKLSGVQRGPSALAKYRMRFEKKQQTRKVRLAAETAASADNVVRAAGATADGAVNTAAAGTADAEGGMQRRSVLQHQQQEQPAAGASSARSAGLSEQQQLLHYGARRLREQQPDLDSEVNPGVSGRGSGSCGGSAGDGSADSGSDSRRRTLLAAAAGGSSGTSNTNSSSSSSGSSLMYKILKHVSTKKDGDGDTSDVYNDDGDDADDASSEEGGGSGAASDAAADAERARKREAWLAKRRAAVADAIEPDVELPELSAVGRPFKSSVGCYLQPSMPRNIGYKDAQLLCVGRNVVLDTCGLFDGQLDGFDVRFPKPKPGALKLGCSIRAPLLGERNFTKGYKNRMWWLNAQDNAYDAVRQSCAPGSGRVVEHPVAFVVRDRYTHTLHELEVLATIFTSLAVANLSEVREHGVQIVIADQMPHASYRPTYAAISWPYRLRHLADSPYPTHTCFRTALFINAFTNSIAFNPNPNTSTCFSPLMIGVHKWLRNLHRELDPAHLARVHAHSASSSETGGIVRRAVVWASRRNLEALRLTSGAGMTEWQSARMVPNENQLVTELQSAVLRWNSRSCLLARYYGGEEGLAGCRESAVQFDLVFGEFSDWPYYPDQLMTIYRTGILIGVHGAALTFVVSTTAGESALLELAGLGWEDTQTGNMLNLFPSLANNVGAYYEQVRYPGPDIDVHIATDALVRAMDEVSTRITANRQRRAAEAAAEQQQSLNDQYNFDIMFPHACPTSVHNKLRRFVTNHPVQMNLDTTSSSVSGNMTSSNSSSSSSNKKNSRSEGGGQ